MSLEAHIETLEKKHAGLDEQARQLHLSCSVPDHEITEVKRRKLRIKDEIERLRTSTRY